MTQPQTTRRDEALLDLLSGWLRRQRWFPAAAQAGFSLRRVGTVPLDSPGPGIGLESVLLAVDTGSTDAPAVVHVPLSFRREPLPAPGEAGPAEAGLIGVLPSGGENGEGPWHVYDGTHDPAFVAAWLELMRSGTDGDGYSGTALAGFSDRAPYDPSLSASVLGGEQSNTSVVVERADGDLIAKFFRVPVSGSNPDVELGVLLTDAGSHEVPLTYGVVSARWDEPSGPVAGALGVLREFITGSEDAWRSASAAALEGRDFTAEAEAIGRATARLHAALRDAAGAGEAGPEEVAAYVAALRDRLERGWRAAAEAVREAASGDSAPENASREHAGGADVEAAFQSVLASLERISALPVLQRIHGDYHLGQVLHAEPRGWVVLDFEGEPLRSAAERTATDVALRDVVGMLRSFDYAGAVAARPESGRGASPAAAHAWAKMGGEAFLSGYAAESGEAVDTGSPLFLALWLDKALYEVAYELQNRPSWVGLPASAVHEVLAGLAPTPPHPARTDVEKEPPVSQPAPHAPLPVAPEALDAVAHGRHHAPHAVLGAHLDDAGFVTIRTLRRFALGVEVVTPTTRVPMSHEYEGIWVAVLPAETEGHVPDYRLEVSYHGGDPVRVDDPYRYLPTLGEVDLHLIGEGRHEKLWEVLGSHVFRYHSVLGDSSGVGFAVWAPHAQAVRVKGDFNGWDGTGHAMRSLGRSGVWELFVPGVEAGAVYKYQILGRDGHWREKADPMAQHTEVPPRTGSVVVESSYGFRDAQWMQERASRDPHTGPLSIYEVHLGSWRPGLSYLELADELVKYVSELGFTHVEFMPVAEHPFGGSWGYQVTSYYAPTSRFGHPDDFRHLVDRLHQAGIGVIVDWVPAHFPKDDWALARFDGEPLYEHADVRRGEHPDWGTLIFDFGRNEVRNFLVANALYWLQEFHIDGLRVDAVASMLYLDYSREDGQWWPNIHGGRENLEAISFLQEANATAYRTSPGIMMIAEESTAFDGVTRPTAFGGLGFGLKWNMGWMHDSLKYIQQDPIHRVYHHDKMTFSLVYAWTENFLLPISHDEVVHGKGSLLRKMPGDRWRQLANVRAYLAYQWAHPGKQLIFMGTEFAQEGEWNEGHGLEWWLAETPQHDGVRKLVSRLNAVYRGHPELWEKDHEPAGFQWIDGGNAAANTFSFIRRDAAGNPLVCVANFSGEPHTGFRLGMPLAGEWTELVNTDDAEYGGSGVGNGGSIMAVDGGEHGQPAHAVLTVPPLGMLYLVPAGTEAGAETGAGAGAETGAVTGAAAHAAAEAVAAEFGLAEVGAEETGTEEDEEDAPDAGAAGEEAVEVGAMEEGALEFGTAEVNADPMDDDEWDAGPAGPENPEETEGRR
ncbi:hypothetical protein NCCP1664_13750 [Zafaria cholistanensis]|uniref:1,4-alpha-glucan branching enzyme GlgB n=1 Tax=Zafaria cholistanensis TaxID=1682741 RepID=A0A5A7NSS4_9MICC|nr:1,4-alpha-glucan branching protein GlgB [Zafaria cholistanensis]GER22878.1 hypothetical protein NCCP1664_13750 [Zafaria cholistanensis]